MVVALETDLAQPLSLAACIVSAVLQRHQLVVRKIVFCEKGVLPRAMFGNKPREEVIGIVEDTDLKAVFFEC